MKCKVCSNEFENEPNCMFCGEGPDMAYFQVRVLDKPNAKLFKLKLNNWANSISDHNYMNLGEQVELKKVTSMPAHAFGVETIIENRELSYRYFVGNRNRIKNRTADIGDIDPWEIKLPYEKGERTARGLESFVFVNEAQTTHTIDCPIRECNSGNVTCGNCGGGGSVGCSECKASGEVTCKGCHGKGISYDPRLDKEVTCPACDGLKVRRCNRCGGSRQLGCGNCRATGAVACSNCEGNGVVDQKIMLTGTISAKVDFHVEQGEVPADAFAFHNKTPKAGIVLLTVENGSVPLSAKDLVPSPEFHQKLSRTIEAHDVVPSSSRIGKRTIWIERKPMIEIEYSHSGSDFRLFLVDADFKPVDDKSPIKSLNQELLSDSAKLLASKNVSEIKTGLELLEKSFRLGQQKKEAQELLHGFLKQLSHRIRNAAYELGDSDWILGLNLLVFRDTALCVDPDEFHQYKASIIEKTMRQLLVLSGGFCFLSLGALYVTQPEDFLSMEILFVFLLIGAALGIIATKNSVDGMMKYEPAKKAIFLKHCLSLAVGHSLFVAAVGGYGGWALLSGIAPLFLPLLGKKRARDFSKKNFGPELKEDNRKLLFGFLDRYGKVIFKD